MFKEYKPRNISKVFYLLPIVIKLFPYLIVFIPFNLHYLLFIIYYLTLDLTPKLFLSTKKELYLSDIVPFNHE